MEASRRHAQWLPSLTRFSLLTTLGLLSAQSQPPAGLEQARVQVVVSGLRSAKGQVACALFRSPEGFPKDAGKAVAHQEVPITGAHATCSFDQIPPGQYAVAVFHDENGNGKMDTNLIGMPREGVGASNNPKTRFGPPKFSESAFTVAAGNKVHLQITVHYL